MQAADITLHHQLVLKTVKFSSYQGTNNSHLLEIQDEFPIKSILQSLNEDQPTSAADEGILCRVCEHKITTPSSLILINDQFIHSFTNPAGVNFKIQCYNSAPGSIISGKPSNYFSWFPEHLWQYCYCKVCQNHLGWYFSCDEGSNFYGLDITQLKGNL